MINKIQCPKCKSEEVKKNAFRKTLNRGKIQRYQCKSCNYRFVEDDGFFRMRNSPQKITLCLDLFFRGISTRRIQGHLKAFYPHNSSNVSIYKWIKKYPKIIGKYVDTLSINGGSELQSDEMEYHRRKSHKRKQGTAINWFVDVMDTKTRYVVSSEYIESRTNERMIKVMKKAKQKTGNSIKVVTTDGLQGYPTILRKSFGLHKHGAVSKIEHNVVIASERGFNHKIERLHNAIREKTKTMRGFHGSVESAKAIMKGIEIYYNFIRKHQALGKTPSDCALPFLELKEDNRWLELIKLASTSSK